MKALMVLIAGLLFLVSFPAYLWVRIFLRPRPDSDLDEYHYEFEDHCPDLVRYEKWSRITFTACALSVLLLFLALVF